MEEAAARLAEAEEAAYEHQRRAARDPTTAHQSSIYPAGAEYALCHAESQLMSCIVAILNESLTESLRGFYKLRTAFSTLDRISSAEKKYLARRGKGSTSTSAASHGAETPADSSGVLTPADDEKDPGDSDDLDPDDYVDVPDLSKLDLDEKLTAKMNGSIVQPVAPPGINANATRAMTEAEQDIDFQSVTSDPIDLFIHSGTNLCFGMLQLMLSMVPPAFSKVLSLFSFRGDRDGGLRMIWAATRYKHNINGAMAGLMTLGFHSAAIGYCDIKRRESMPYDRLRQLLKEMRKLYPKSKLWLLEEARMLGEEQQLEKAVMIMTGGGPSELRQVEAMRTFEAALFHMYLHQFQECADTFIRCVDLNSWSHALYYYIAGACYVELYRSQKTAEPAKAKEYAAKADEYLHMVPDNMSKKRIMGRQMPFDVFVQRKITKWDARAKARNCQFVDAVGVSPVDEMAYFWSGYKRMNASQLELSLQRLARSEDPEINPAWKKEAADERSMLHVLRATCQRFLGQTAEAKATLEKNVLCFDTSQIKSCEHPDTWPLPVAHYEMAVCFWQEAPGQDGDRAALQKCSEYVEKVAKWESYDLETRVGLKVATARETLKRCGISPQ